MKTTTEKKKYSKRKTKKPVIRKATIKGYKETPKKRLSPKTRRRIRAGLRKFSGLKSPRQGT